MTRGLLSGRIRREERSGKTDHGIVGCLRFLLYENPTSAIAGETPFQCAVRELREETGIAAVDLVEVGREVSSETRGAYVEFLCVTDWEKDKITLQDGETAAYRWVSRDELLAMKRDELVTKRMQKYIDELMQ